MRAVQYSTFGGPEALAVVDVPEPKAFIDLVTVAVEAAALNPADLGFQSGAVDGFVDFWFPVVPGWDVAGVVESVGIATTGFQPGDEVIGFVRAQVMHHGTYAEKVVAQPRQLVRKPATSTWAQAAGLPLAGLTAFQAVVHALSVTEGEVMLIHGAAGGVGHLAVQIARARGAQVIGVGSAASQDFITSLGATAVRYDQPVVEHVLAVAPQGVDVVLDCAGRGSLATTRHLAAPGVRVATITRATEYEEAQDVFVDLDEHDLLRLVELVEAGQLTVHVQRTFALEEAARAQELLAAGHVHGKLVLTTDREGVR